MTKLDQNQIDAALGGLAGWSYTGKLHKQFVFKDFVHAFGFMSTSALVIEKLNHHPEWSNVWNRVTVDLTTHDAGGVTEKDVELASELNRIASLFP